MNWKFWQKKPSGQPIKLDKPKDLPSAVGRSLVVDKQLDPDWVWHLKIVTMAKENQKGIYDFRIFDPDSAAAKGIAISDYKTLDGTMDLVLFDGWYDKGTWELSVNDRSKSLKKESAA